MSQPDPVQAAQALESLVERLGEAASLSWLQRILPRPGQALQGGIFFGGYAGAARRFRGPAALDGAAKQQLAAAGVLQPAVWSLSDVVRALLLLRAAAELPLQQHGQLVKEALQKGDTGERVATLRALCLLPQPQRFLELAVDQCRSNVADVFDAIACDNPYPAQHFPDANFNQLVMKSLFTSVPLARVHAWQSRVSPELARMARDFAAERMAAGRVVPDGVALIEQALESAP